MFLLRISLENVNASVVTYRYPQIYNFSFRKELLEIICKRIYLEFYPQVLQHVVFRTVPASVPPPGSILENNT